MRIWTLLASIVTAAVALGAQPESRYIAVLNCGGNGPGGLKAGLDDGDLEPFFALKQWTELVRLVDSGVKVSRVCLRAPDGGHGGWTPGPGHGNQPGTVKDIRGWLLPYQARHDQTKRDLIAAVRQLCGEDCEIILHVGMGANGDVQPTLDSIAFCRLERCSLSMDAIGSMIGSNPELIRQTAGAMGVKLYFEPGGSPGGIAEVQAPVPTIALAQRWIYCRNNGAEEFGAEHIEWFNGKTDEELAKRPKFASFDVNEWAMVRFAEGDTIMANPMTLDQSTIALFAAEYAPEPEPEPAEGED